MDSGSGGSEAGALDGMDLDIYGFWAECRRDQPVVEVDGSTMGRPTWMVTRYDDVESVFRDPDRFSSRINNETMGPVMGALILGMDGDEHRRYRSLVAQAFRPSALAALGRGADSADDHVAPRHHRAARARRSGRGRDEPVPGAGDRGRARHSGRGLPAVPEGGRLAVSARARRTTTRACRPRRRIARTWSPSWHRGGRIRATTSSWTSSPPRSTAPSCRRACLRLLAVAVPAEPTASVMGSTLSRCSRTPT